MSERHTAPADQKSGTVIHTPYDGGPVTQQDTVSCKHCGRVWVWVKGSGRRRGFCTRCNGFTCGRPMCDHHRTAEQLIENIEQGRPLDYTPIRVSMGGILIPGG